MAHGLPVICSKVCGTSEPVIDGETGYIVDVEKTNLDDIVDKAYDLLIDNKNLEVFRRNAYEHAMRNWQWKHVAENIMNAYLKSDGHHDSITARAR